MKIDELNRSYITADEGKVLRRRSDGFIYGSEVALGYTYYINGKKLESPLLEIPDHFEEIEEPSAEPDVLIDKDYPLAAEVRVSGLLPEAEMPPEPVKPVTIDDYRELEKKVEQLMKMIGGTE